MQKTLMIALQEASKVFEPFAFLYELPDERQKSIWGALLLDMAYIAARIARLAESVSREEALVAALFLRYPFLSESERKRYERWEELSVEMREALARHAHELFDKLAHRSGQVLRTPAVFRELAAERDDASLYDRYQHSMYRFAQVIAKIDGIVDIAEGQELEGIWRTLCGEPSQAGHRDPPLESCEDLLRKIEQLVGLTGVKESIRKLVSELSTLPNEQGRNLSPPHLAFVGPHGTGKTTIAHYLGRMLRTLGVLPKGQVVEVDCAMLLGSSPEECAANVAQAAGEALGGILFIDEACVPLLTDDQLGAGAACNDVLLRNLKPYLDRLSVVLTGGEREMNRLLALRPQLNELFAGVFRFEHYAPHELQQMFQLFCANAKYSLSAMATRYVRELCERLHDERDDSFGNGRLIRTIFERTIERQVHRVSARVPLTSAMLSTIEIDDLPLVPVTRGVRRRAA